MTTLREEWVNFVSSHVLNEPYMFAGQQAIYRDAVWEIPAQLLLEDQSMTIENVGMTQAKIKMLRRHYLDQKSIDAAIRHWNHRLDNRKYGGCQWVFRGHEKKNTKQDFCLSSGIITYYPPHRHSSIHIYYRTVELTWRYRPDLIFLRDEILPHFDFSRAIPDKVRFVFTNATIHPIFFILVLLEMDNMGPYLRELKKSNPKFYKHMSKMSYAHLNGKYRGYHTAERVQRFMERAFTQKKMDRLRDLLA